MKYIDRISLFLALSILAGCVTQKKKEDVGAIGKIYHNTTARYNGYYNADLLLQESILELENQTRDNYSKLLPIYKYVEAPNPKAVAEKLNKAMEKMAVVVNMHRVSHWTDDCYLLFGKAQFLKQDYEAAEKTFQFMVAEFHPAEVAKREAKMQSAKKRKQAARRGEAPAGSDEVKSLSRKEREKLAKQERKQREKERKAYNRAVKKARKKGSPPPPRPGSKTKEEKPDKSTEEVAVTPDTLETQSTRPAPGSIRLGSVQPVVPEGKPEKYILKHRPAYQEAVLWLARTYIERENYAQAERLLKQLETSSATYDDVRREAALAKAHMYIRQKQYEQAIPALEYAISIQKDNQLKARLSFILGQLNQMLGRSAQAYAAFDQVLKFRPPYEMEFSARMNLATAGVNSDEESIAQLESMLKEEKNKEFRDQIYFSLAQIEQKRGNKEAVKDYLRKSLDANSGNQSQRAEAYLMLANLYFDDQDFVKAKLYYDSTLQVLPVTDERYFQVSSMAANLDGIAQNLMIIAEQDSLLRIARMSDEEKRELAARIKKEQNEQRLRELRQKAIEQNQAQQGRSPARNFGNSNFWAYNDKQLKQGLKDFQKRWGTRVLEDDWRRSSRQAFAAQDESFSGESYRTSSITDEEIQEILRDVPKNDKEITISHRQIESALFTLGTLYRDRLQNHRKAIETFLELLNRYPQTQYILDAMYYLHLCYKDLGDEANAQYYYDKIVNGYPETRYAKMLKDPNYADAANEEANKLTKYYDQTYAAFASRRYQEAYERVSKAGELFGATNSLQPRFALLGAMCLGNLKGRDAYVEALKDLIAKYPESPEATRAREILRLLGEQIATGPGQQRDLPTQAGQVGAFKPNDDQLHYVIVIFHQDVSLNDAKVAVSDFNQKFYSLKRLRMNNIYLDDGERKIPLVAIRSFRDKKEAMDYYDTVQKNLNQFLDPSQFTYEVFPITQDNYRELLKSKAVDDYRSFFHQNYLN